MQSYLVESYASCSVVDEQLERARRAADLSAGIRYVRTTFLPADETVLHMFEATSREALCDAARQAALPYERIVEAVEGADEHLTKVPGFPRYGAGPEAGRLAGLGRGSP